MHFGKEHIICMLYAALILAGIFKLSYALG